MVSTASCVSPFPRYHPRIEAAREGGWYVLRDEHGWLVGDRRAALAEFDELLKIERGRGRG